MATLDTDVSVATRALLLIGCNPIESFLDETVEARVADELYGHVKRKLLTEAYWRFATKIVSLAEDADDVEADLFGYAYQLPSDLIAVRSQIEQAASTAASTRGMLPARGRYEIVGNRLLSDLSPCYLEYTRNVTEAEMPPHFVDALVHALAAAFVMPLTERADVADYWDGKAKHLLGRAKIIDAQQRPEQPFVATDFLTVRY